MGWSAEKVFPKGRRRGLGDRVKCRRGKLRQVEKGADSRAGGKVGRPKRKLLTQQNPFSAGKIGAKRVVAVVTVVTIVTRREEEL